MTLKANRASFTECLSLDLVCKKKTGSFRTITSLHVLSDLMVGFR